MDLALSWLIPYGDRSMGTVPRRETMGVGRGSIMSLTFSNFNSCRLSGPQRLGLPAVGRGLPGGRT
jgi:hypothetical protein